MDTMQIDYVATTDSVLRRLYKGCYSIDTIPRINFNTSDWYFIFNSVPSQDVSVMGHWLMIFSRDNRMYFFDSFGLPMHHYNIDNRLSSACEIINFPLQSANSLVCGPFTLYFAYFMSSGVKAHKIVTRFSRIYRRNNDAIVMRFMSKLTRNTCTPFLCPTISLKEECSRNCNCGIKHKM